jgi:hypothetical protein
MPIQSAFRVFRYRFRLARYNLVQTNKSLYARRLRGSFAVDELEICVQLAEIFENAIDDGKRDLPFLSRNKPTSSEKQANTDNY